MNDLHDALWDWAYYHDTSLLDDEEAFESLLVFIEKLILSSYRAGRRESYQPLERNREN